MRWKKLGLVYGPNGFSPWADHSAITPTPVLLDDKTFRVYAGFRDKQGISRIGWVDVDPDNPNHVIRVSKEPALDVGKPGCFDDNGVILGDIVKLRNRLRMYYVGFQLAKGVKFLAFTGAAESLDGGDSFTRLSETPVLDRSGEGLYIRAIHSVLRIKKSWRIWYSVGSRWEYIGGAPYPSYYIKTQDSTDGLCFSDEGSLCLPERAPEYRLGRPRVWKGERDYHMLFTFGTTDGLYLPGYASSKDGLTWERDDSRVGLTTSPDDWDSRMLCYPVPICVKGKWYLIYNGNEFGKAGFGCAVLESGGM